MNYYFKRTFEEDRIEEGNNWGQCTYYLETDEVGEILRQIEVYDNGMILKYSEQSPEDNFGFLADQPIEITEFEEFAITPAAFEQQWEHKGK